LLPHGALSSTCTAARPWIGEALEREDPDAVVVLVRLMICVCGFICALTLYCANQSNLRHHSRGETSIHLERLGDRALPWLCSSICDSRAHPCFGWQFATLASPDRSFSRSCTPTVDGWAICLHQSMLWMPVARCTFQIERSARGSPNISKCIRARADCLLHSACMRARVNCPRHSACAMMARLVNGVGERSI
jgi:hypothetical protein